MREWSATVEVDAAIVRALIGEQFPEVELRSARKLAEGWDNTVWVVDERWAFRFPRRELGAECMERELGVLGWLAPQLTLRVPAPVFRGRPADGYPWPFAGAELLPGRELADVALDDGARARLARPLAAFLRTLHGLDTSAPEARALAVDFNRRADMPLRIPAALERLAEVERLGRWRAPSSVRRLFDDAPALPDPVPSAIVHGDLHIRHLLVDDGGAASAVIDWGDVCRADPAIDLMLYWCALPPRARDAFRDEYGPLREDQLVRARVLAIFLCAALTQYACHEGFEPLARAAVEGLERAAAE